MASEQLAAFKKAKKAEEKVTIASLAQRCEDARRQQEQEFAILEKAKKEGEEQRKKAAEDAAQAELQRMAKVHAIRRQELLAEMQKVKAQIAAERAEAERKAAECLCAENEALIEAALAKVKKEKEQLVGHAEYARQPQGVKDLLDGMHHSDALEALSSPLAILAMQRTIYKRAKRPHRS